MRVFMSPHHREERYLEELIRDKFSVSLMSNSKWVKLIAALVENYAEVKECLVKPIWDDQQPFRQLLIDDTTTYDHDYYNSAMEGMVSDKPRGWYAYKEIEWLDFPRQLTNKTDSPAAVQNLELINQLIDGAGKYFVELTPDNLRLYAYLK
jgi:hypothetical protein